MKLGRAIELAPRVRISVFWQFRIRSEFFSGEHFKKHDIDHWFGGQFRIFRVSVVINNKKNLSFSKSLQLKNPSPESDTVKRRIITPLFPLSSPFDHRMRSPARLFTGHYGKQMKWSCIQWILVISTLQEIQVMTIVHQKQLKIGIASGSQFNWLKNHLKNHLRCPILGKHQKWVV